MGSRRARQPAWCAAAATLLSGPLLLALLLSAWHRLHARSPPPVPKELILKPAYHVDPARYFEASASAPQLINLNRHCPAVQSHQLPPDKATLPPHAWLSAAASSADSSAAASAAYTATSTAAAEFTAPHAALSPGRPAVLPFIVVYESHAGAGWLASLLQRAFEQSGEVYSFHSFMRTAAVEEGRDGAMRTAAVEEGRDEGAKHAAAARWRACLRALRHGPLNGSSKSHTRACTARFDAHRRLRQHTSSHAHAGQPPVRAATRAAEPADNEPMVNRKANKLTTALPAAFHLGLWISADELQQVDLVHLLHAAGSGVSVVFLSRRNRLKRALSREREPRARPLWTADDATAASLPPRKAHFRRKSTCEPCCACSAAKGFVRCVRSTVRAAPWSACSQHFLHYSPRHSNLIQPAPLVARAAGSVFTARPRITSFHVPLALAEMLTASLLLGVSSGWTMRTCSTTAVSLAPTASIYHTPFPSLLFSLVTSSAHAHESVTSIRRGEPRRRERSCCRDGTGSRRGPLGVARGQARIQRALLGGRQLRRALPCDQREPLAWRSRRGLLSGCRRGLLSGCRRVPLPRAASGDGEREPQDWYGPPHEADALVQ